jgi:hypothetical protein
VLVFLLAIFVKEIPLRGRTAAPATEPPAAPAAELGSELVH